MLNSRLKPITAFGEHAPRTDTIGDIILSEGPDLAIASVALRRGGDQSELAQFLGASLPGPDHAARMEPVDAFWTAADQWFFVAPYQSHETLADMIKVKTGSNASVTEQSDAWSCFEVQGLGIAALLERLSMLDLARAPAGYAARTVVHHVGCFFICDSPGQKWRILGPRTMAPWLYEAVKTVATGLAERR